MPCIHNKPRSLCRECGGKGICVHNKRQYHCRECGGKGICIHNKQQSLCRECGGKAFCVHNKRRDQCRECGGKGICTHNKLRYTCRECGGKAFCTHNKQRSQCRECNGKAFCPHNKRREQCRECGGKAFCTHNKQRRQCVDCKGASICTHNKLRHRCVDCKGSSLCEHNRIRATCRICNKDHPFYGVTDRVGPSGNIRASDLEHVMLDTLIKMLPVATTVKEQLKIDALGGTHYVVDIECVHVDTFRFILEVDGAQHYQKTDGTFFQDFVSQQVRDRYIEEWGVLNGYSVFRVPQTLQSKAKRTQAMEYCIRAATYDYNHGTPRVHYLDFNKTYDKINMEAAQSTEIDFIQTIAVTGQEILNVHCLCC